VPISKCGWTKWEAMQLADKLEANRAMAKADWECWKKLEEGFENFTDSSYLIWMMMTKKMPLKMKG
jgi:hypothetical protein